MNRNDYTQYTGYTGSQSPEPTDPRPAYAAPPMHRAYAGAVPNGSLRSTRTNAASNGVASGNSAYPQAGRVFQGSLRRAHLGTFDDYSHQQQQQQQQQLQPYVPDASERRTPDYYTQMAGARATSPPQIAAMPAYHESDYYTPRSTSMRKYDEPQQQQQPHRVTSPVAPLPQQRYARRGSTASNSGAPRITTVEARKSPGPQRLFSSQRVEFGYTSPAPQSALSRSSTPERDEIADIIKDMSNSRIGEISVYLQLHDETKKVKVPLGALSMATLVNLFSDKYRDRLEALGEKEKNAVLPEIYIKDAKSDVFYELEDTKDVVDGSVLSWRPRVIEKTDADKRESVEDIVKALVETVAQLPVQLRGELETVAKDMKTHSDAAIESVKTQIQQITATIASPAPQVSDEIKDTEPSGRPGQLSRSVSLPAAPKAETEVLNTRIRKLELDLAVERQAHRETSEQLARENTQLSEALAKLQAEVAKHPNVLRVRIEEGKQKLKTTYRSLNGRFEDLDALTQEMRKDVTQRGSIPSNQIMKKSAADLRAIEEETKELLAFISTTQADWKRAWEEELQNILNEQRLVKDVEAGLGELLEDTKHLSGVLEKLDKVVDLKLEERARKEYSPKFIDVVSPDEAKDAKEGFLRQITCVDVDHQRRLDALEVAERLRRQELSAKVNEFDEELEEFVSQRKLRKTGGTEEVERRREEKNAEIMKEMMKSAEEAEAARRAKVAQRKAAKSKK